MNMAASINAAYGGSPTPTAPLAASSQPDPHAQAAQSAQTRIRLFNKQSLLEKMAWSAPFLAQLGKFFGWIGKLIAKVIGAPLSLAADALRKKPGVDQQQAIAERAAAAAAAADTELSVAEAAQKKDSSTTDMKEDGLDASDAPAASPAVVPVTATVGGLALNDAADVANLQAEVQKVIDNADMDAGLDLVLTGMPEDVAHVQAFILSHLESLREGSPLLDIDPSDKDGAMRVARGLGEETERIRYAQRVTLKGAVAMAEEISKKPEYIGTSADYVINQVRVRMATPEGRATLRDGTPEARLAVFLNAERRFAADYDRRVIAATTLISAHGDETEVAETIKKNFLDGANSAEVALKAREISAVAAMAQKGKYQFADDPRYAIPPVVKKLESALGAAKALTIPPTTMMGIAGEKVAEEAKPVDNTVTEAAVGVVAVQPSTSHAPGTVNAAGAAPKATPVVSVRPSASGFGGAVRTGSAYISPDEELSGLEDENTMFDAG